MRTVLNIHGFCGNSVGILDRCEIKRKRVIVFRELKTAGLLVGRRRGSVMTQSE